MGGPTALAAPSPSPSEPPRAAAARPLGTGSLEPASPRPCVTMFPLVLDLPVALSLLDWLILLLLLIIMIIIIFPPRSSPPSAHPKSTSVPECSCLWLHSFLQEEKKRACLM